MKILIKGDLTPQKGMTTKYQQLSTPLRLVAASALQAPELQRLRLTPKEKKNKHTNQTKLHCLKTHKLYECTQKP